MTRHVVGAALVPPNEMLLEGWEGVDSWRVVGRGTGGVPAHQA